ncbi:hypothetical protein K0M31_020342 [Melipona bicolor]|uniref:Uncharacterized protein n=1 Tax=Melipona bicolor TaxID=60889 RepID=A0AA40G1Z1_9HYME|nr:hypothetical protein K0M31_020342 [Melipona bicolor]
MTASRRRDNRTKTEEEITAFVEHSLWEIFVKRCRAKSCYGLLMVTETSIFLITLIHDLCEMYEVKENKDFIIGPEKKTQRP